MASQEKVPHEESRQTVDRGQLVVIDEVDAALAAKMTLVNKAINDVGYTGYHWKLFFLNGGGYAVDSLVVYLMSICKNSVAMEYPSAYIPGAQIALYVGLLVGSLFWGLGADIIGRRWAFNFSLFIGAAFGLIGGAATSFTMWCIFVCFLGFGVGGNLVLDTTAFLEFLPMKDQWQVTLLAIWWGVGQTMAGLLAYAFLPNFSCATAEGCSRSANMGWRYMFFTSGAFVLVLSVARVTVIRFHETPKYLICRGQDEKVVTFFQDLAKKYHRSCDLTLEDLQRSGTVTSAHARSRFSFGEILVHYRGLFATKKLAWSTSLIWVSWTLIGLAFPLFFVYLPDYLASRGAAFGQTSTVDTWRDYVLAQFSSIWGPLVAAFACRTRLGRKYTMVIGALLSMAMFFAYTAVRNNAQNVAFNCVVSFTVNIYYGTLYAYSPEVLPSAHRATGNGTAIALNRVMGIMSAVIATYAKASTPIPVYICAALFAVMAVVSAILPFEPQVEQSV